MSDWIEHDGKKYYEESYITLANQNALRVLERLAALTSQNALAIYAWVGEDENGSGKVGIKQGSVPAGIIPLAAMSYHLDRLAKLLPAMEAQAERYGKKIRLCKFVMTEIAAETKAGV